MIILSMAITLVGCSKNETDNTTTKDQYVGTYQGTIVYNDGTAQSGQVTLSIVLSNGVLTGYFQPQDDPYAYRLREVSFEDGVLHVSFVCSSPEEEDCANFSVTGTLTFVDNIIIIGLSGTFCGSGGGIQATVSGNLPRIDPIPDVTNFFTFAQAGREWRYKVTGFDGTACFLSFHLTEDLGNGVFGGSATNDCNWQWDVVQFWWYVSPNAWCDMMTASLNSRILNLMSDAKVGDIYTTIIGNDSIVVEVISLNDPVVIDGNTYNCLKLLKKGKQFDHYSEGYSWVTFDIGMVKYEAIIPNQATDVHLEELIWKNF